MTSNFVTKLSLAAIVSTIGLGSVALAEDLKDACVRLVENDGGDIAVCDCITNAIGSDQTLQADAAAIVGIDDPQERVAAASDGLAAIIMECRAEIADL